MIRLRVLGQSVVEVKQKSVRPDAELVFATLLYLCAERGRRVERDALAELLWPRESTTRRRHSLRQILYKLRRLGADCSHSAEALAIQASSVWLDFEDGDAANEADVGRELLAPSGVQCLPGYAPRFSKQFSAWIDDFRLRVEAATRTRFAAAIARARQKALWPEVERLARNCLKLDPLNEEATLALAEATALAGAKARAIEMLDTYLRELGPGARDVKLPATVLRRRIADRIPSRQPAGGTVTALVGREPIMRDLTDALDEMRAGRPQIHALWGPSGIGKTRIVEELSTLAALKGVSIASAHAGPNDAQTPGVTFTRLVREMLGLPGVLGLSPDVLSLLQRLTAQRASTEPARPEDSNEDTLVRAFADLDRALCWEMPLVVVLDDVQFADDLSRRVIARAHACMTSERLLLLVSGIPHPVEFGFAKVVAHEVPRLEHSAAADLAGLLLAAASLDASQLTREAFAVASGGHPFVLREAVAAASVGGATNPETSLEGLLHQRVGALSEDSRDVLLSALVLGEHATVASLVRSALGSQRAVENALVELEREQILSFAASGRVDAHALWHDLVDRLFPVSRVTARRMHLAQLLQQWSSESVTRAEQLLASGTLFQQAGDVARAAVAFSASGAALRNRALSAGAYHAYNRAAEIAPGAHDFDRWVFQAIRSAHDAELAHELSALLSTFGPRLRTSAHLSSGDAAELEIIDSERLHALGDSSAALLDRCASLAMDASLDPRQRLRAALTLVRIADNNGDTASVQRICELVREMPAADADSQRIQRWLTLVGAMSTGNLGVACTIASMEIERSEREPQLVRRCRTLIDSRVPFLYDCDFDQVEAVLKAARAALSDYPATRLSLRADDAFATYCVEMMRLDEAEDFINRNELVARTYGFGPLTMVLAETRARYLLARQRLGPSDTPMQDALRRTAERGGTRLRAFALSTASIAAARAGDLEALRPLSAELGTHWKQLSRTAPIDYLCFAFSIATLVVEGRASATAVLNDYFDRGRIARRGPSPFVRALAQEFGFDVASSARCRTRG